ncbi:TPA: hypothetical protein DD394_06230 [bacterium UBP9_UBA11836]|nr:hypothetical protein [bacterium UBP9_UBA11836]
MGIVTPLVFVGADKVALIRKNILTPPDPSVLPWSPMPRLDEKAIELKERQEEAQKQLEAQRAEAAKRAYSQPSLGSRSSLFGNGIGQSEATTKSSEGFAFTSPAPVRKPNLGGALRKLEEARPQAASRNLPGAEVPPGFSDLTDSEIPPGFADIERKAEVKKQAEAGIFGRVEGAPRRRPRSEDRDERERTSSERHRRASRNQEINLNFLKAQVFGN